jgi:hypothetical protein
VLRSVKEGQWINEEEFEASGDTFAMGAPLQFRTKANNIFSGQSFFFKGIFSPPR